MASDELEGDVDVAAEGATSAFSSASCAWLMDGSLAPMGSDDVVGSTLDNRLVGGAVSVEMLEDVVRFDVENGLVCLLIRWPCSFIEPTTR